MSTIPKEARPKNPPPRRPVSPVNIHNIFRACRIERGTGEGIEKKACPRNRRITTSEQYLWLMTRLEKINREQVLGLVAPLLNCSLKLDRFKNLIWLPAKPSGGKRGGEWATRAEIGLGTRKGGSVPSSGRPKGRIL